MNAANPDTLCVTYYVLCFNRNTKSREIKDRKYLLTQI